MTMKIAFPALLLLAGCGSDEEGNGADKVVEAAVQTATLTGLYEAPGGAEPSQLCIVDRGPGNARFGLVLRGAGEASCSGAGGAVRQGEVLRLEMGGDEACTIEARIEGGDVAFPTRLPAGCAYYCGSGATMASASFAKIGGTAQDAMRARDLVGDPLCAGTGTP